MKRKSVQYLLIVLLACFTAAVVANGGNPHPRPLMGSMSGEATYDWESGACLPVTGAPWRTINYMVGHVTHLGWTEYYSHHCADPVTFALEAGEATMVAANGDEIWFTYTAELITPFTPPPVTVVYAVENVVVGGTGRFENASGEFLSLVAVTIEDLADPSTPLTQEIAGSMTY